MVLSIGPGVNPTPVQKSMGGGGISWEKVIATAVGIVEKDAATGRANHLSVEQVVENIVTDLKAAFGGTTATGGGPKPMA